jgi:hypothetical protein
VVAVVSMSKQEFSRIGADQGAAGQLPGASAARARGAAATAKTTSRRRVCRQRAGHHATVLRWFRPDPAAPFVFRYVTKLATQAGHHRAVAKWVF